MASSNPNAIEVPIEVDATKAEVSLRKFDNSMKNFCNNYSSWTERIVGQSRRQHESIMQLSTTITFVGAAFTTVKGVVDSLAGSYMSFTDGLSKMSQRTGIAAESLGGLKFAAEQSGANFETLTQGLKQFQNVLAQQKQDGKNKLGIDYTSDTEEALMRFADRVKNMSSQTEQVKAATEAFGKAGFKLVPMLQEGRAGIQKLKEEAKRLGLTLDEVSIQEGVKMTDATNRMKQSFAAVNNQIIAQLAPTLTQMFDWFAKGAASVTSWISQNQVFVASLGKLTLAFMGVAGVLKVIPVALTAICAHPIVAVVAGLAVAVAALDAALSPVPKKFDAVTDSMQRQRQETDDLINADKQRIQRLKELEALSKRGGLNNQEVAEATNLVTELSARYGDLGISIDAASGKITGMGEATKKMYAQMIESRKNALQKELLELQSNQQSLIIQRENVWNKGGLSGTWDKMTGAEQRNADDLTQQIQSLTSQIALVQAEIKNVDKSIVDNTKSNIKGKTPAEIRREMEARQNLAKYNDDMKKHYMSDRERELAAIDEETANYLKEYGIAEEEDVNGIDLHSDYNQRRLAYYDNPENMKRLEEQAASGRVDAQGKLADVRLLQKLRMQEERKAEVNAKYDQLDADEKKKAEEEAIAKQQKSDELAAYGVKGGNSRLIAAQREYNELYNKLYLNDNLNRPEEERRSIYQQMVQARARMQEEQANTKARAGVEDQKSGIAELQKQLNEKIVNNDFEGRDELKKQIEDAQLELAKTVATVSGKARETAQKEYDKERAEYQKMVENGATNDELEKQREKVEAAKTERDKQSQEYDNAVGEIQAAQEREAKNRIDTAKQQLDSATSRGTFNAWETGTIGNTTARQQLETSKKMLDELIKIQKNTEEGAVTA